MILIILVTLLGNDVVGQNRKELKLTVLQLQSDSTSLDKKLKENQILVANLNTELSEIKISNQQLKNRIEELALVYDKNASLSDSIIRLNDSITKMNVKLDSIDKYYRIINFVKAFYNSLETTDEENLRQYEYGDMKFDLENFYSLITRNARYSEGRVKNLSDDRFHHKYFIMLQSIDEIKFSLNKILVKTKVMYTGERMGLFYNEEQLTLKDNKGLIKLTDWVDLDLYKMMPTIDASVDNFSREDFYRWLDGRPK
ncbi:hypothetical protein EI546_09940 [Aequorivita sp. H23M31]|uniref:Uncharacterized protein n=1 Tax=Aequorivita ciconiae TaxID=2494375 RepID=A0A410G426_9FLAO|nr:hypothetical protein [Aequorivita sp. H23M31]QAA82024.1 hypothetical protein EI546_09940 [Aequorivita sp. H23M31]